MVCWLGENRPPISLQEIGFQIGPFSQPIEKAWGHAAFEEFDALQGVGRDLPRTRFRSTANNSREANGEHGTNRTSRGLCLAPQRWLVGVENRFGSWAHHRRHRQVLQQAGRLGMYLSPL